MVPVGRLHCCSTKSRPHVAHFAAAHGVGLTGQRHRAAARPTDRPGGQVKVADCVGVPGAVGGLVQPHGPATHPLPRVGDHARRGTDVGLRDTGDIGDQVWRIVREEAWHIGPAIGVLGDEIGIDVAVFD